MNDLLDLISEMEERGLGIRVSSVYMTRAAGWSCMITIGESPAHAIVDPILGVLKKGKTQHRAITNCVKAIRQQDEANG
jgi:hypothetical protein